MNPFQARAFIEQVINAPSMPAAQMLVESNLVALDATFFQVLQAMIQEAQAQGQFGSNLFSPNMPGIVADYFINRNEQASQRVQALQMLYQYAANRKQQTGWQPAQRSPGGQPAPLQVTCQGCGQTHPVLCPGFGYHALSQTVVANATGGVCAICGAEFTYVTCVCGTVTYLPAAGESQSQNFQYEDDDIESEQTSDEEDAPGSDLSWVDNREEEQPPAAQASEDTSIQDLFGILKQQFEKEKSSGRMDSARQSGLGDIMERLGEMVENDRPDRSLEEMTRDRGKLDEMMAQMMSRVKKPTFAGPQLPEDSRAAKVLALLQELKAFVGAEGMKQQKTSGETQKAGELFASAARLTTRLHETRGDERGLVNLETDQVRSLVNDIRLFARRHYLTLARPVWSHGQIPLNPNLIFFSGPEHTRQCLERAAARIDLEVSRPVRPGADVAESRWQALRASSLCVFDISSPSPQVFYELGIALALGTELLLIAESGADPPFDIAQSVHHYRDAQDLEGFFASELDAALYGLQTSGSDGSSLAASVAYAGRLAEAVGNDGLLRVALESLRKVGSDPVEAPSGFKLLNTFLGESAHLLLYPRKPGFYPDRAHPRCFIVMPFRDKLNRIYETITRACREANVEPVRGDVAAGQEIIESIWEEIGRATHITVDLTDFNPNVCLELGIADTLGRRTLLIAAEGTEEHLKKGEFPGVAKRRCHTYPIDPASKPAFLRALTDFLKEPPL